VNLTINTNLAAITALNNVEQSNAELQTSITRLSTGLRINSGADDPAGLVITQNMQAQIAGLNQASQNTQDGINMLKTADGGMAEIQNLLIQVRALAVASANTAVADASTLQANQLQIQSTIQSIDRIASSTQFGTKELLNGTAGTTSNVTDAKDVASVYIGGTFGGSTVVNGPISVGQVTPASKAQITLTKTFASPNSIVPTVGTFVVNGYAFDSTGGESLSTIVGSINQMSDTTGVTAQIIPNGPNFSIQLNQNTYGSQFDINYADASGILNTATTANSSGTDGVYNVTVATIDGNKTVAFTGGQGSATSGLTLSDNTGNSLVLTEAGNSDITVTQAVAQLTASQVQFQVGAYAGQSVAFSMPSAFANQLGTTAIPGQNVSTMNVNTQNGANNAIQIIDAAINQVSLQRGSIGAFQANFLESNSRSLNVASQNITASMSDIRDTNMASEITNFTKYQILEQSGITVLSQANQLPQQILTLLKGA